jgi:tetratricopeptide (TPR) repeat protein
VDFADQDENQIARTGTAYEKMLVYQQIGSRALLGNALHQTGRMSDAEEAFIEAEERQGQFQPEYSILYAGAGFWYCDLLLDLGKYQDVQIRASQTLAWATEFGNLLDIANDNVSLGRAYLLQALRDSRTISKEAASLLERAVEILRRAGLLDRLVGGLLVRSFLYRINGEFNSARADLDEASRLALRGSMGLHKADCHLEYARLYLAQNEQEKARGRWATAKGMIERMGYHRRDKDVKEIEAQLDEM